jgi:hypothetical protein
MKVPGDRVLANVDTFSDQLECMRGTPGDLAAAIDGQPAAVLARRPAEKAWSAKEIVCHLRDVEEFYLDRIKILLINDEPPLILLEPDRWAEDRQYLRHDVGEALRAFRLRREDTLEFLVSLRADEWSRGGMHPLLGRITVGKIVRSMPRHDQAHLDQLRRALAGQP